MYVKLKEKYVSIMIILLAIGGGVLIFYFKGGWQGRGGPTVSPSALTQLKETTLSELAKKFPSEFLVDNNATNVEEEIESANRTNVIFASKLTPAELLDRFVASIQSKGWLVSNAHKSENIAQADAFNSGRIVSFQALKISEAVVQVIIKYNK